MISRLSLYAAGAMLIMAIGTGVYAQYLSGKLKFSKLQNAQYERDLKGWEISYNSLADEYKKTQAVTLALRKNLNRLRKVAQARATKFEALKNDIKIKSWATTAIPVDVIKFMQLNKKPAAAKSDPSKTAD